MSTILIYIVVGSFTFLNLPALYNEHSVLLSERNQRILGAKDHFKLQKEHSAVLQLLGEENPNMHVRILEVLHNFQKENILEVTAIPSLRSYQKDDLTIFYQEIHVEASFFVLLQLLNLLEIDKSLGSVVSANFTPTNPKKSSHPISLSMILQNISTHETI